METLPPLVPGSTAARALYGLLSGKLDVVRLDVNEAGFGPRPRSGWTLYTQLTDRFGFADCPRNNPSACFENDCEACFGDKPLVDWKNTSWSHYVSLRRIPANFDIPLDVILAGAVEVSA